MAEEEEKKAITGLAATAAAPPPAAAQVIAGAAKYVVADEQKKPCAAAKKKKKVRMPDNYVASILTLKRNPRRSPEYMESLSPEEREGEVEDAELGDEFEAFQEEVRRAVENDGCYMVGESYFAETAAIQAAMEEEWAKIDMSRVIFGDWDYDDPESVQYL
uniref:Uncharacterized protein n=1 Tax=Oryza glaberrima TaxID=4538 RepID=I1QVS3_ORYGL